MGIDPAGNCAAGNDAEEQWRDETGIDEDAIVDLLHVIMYRIIIAECEGCSPGNNAQKHDEQRDVQVNGHGGIDGRETDEQDDDGDDKPHVVGLPYRADGVVADAPGLRAVGFGGEQFDDTRAKIGPA